MWNPLFSVASSSKHQTWKFLMRVNKVKNGDFSNCFLPILPMSDFTRSNLPLFLGEKSLLYSLWEEGVVQNSSCWCRNIVLGTCSRLLGGRGRGESKSQATTEVKGKMPWWDLGRRGGKLQPREQVRATILERALCIDTLSTYIGIWGTSLGFQVPPGIFWTCLLRIRPGTFCCKGRSEKRSPCWVHIGL